MGIEAHKQPLSHRIQDKVFGKASGWKLYYVILRPPITQPKNIILDSIKERALPAASAPHCYKFFKWKRKLS
jgi:hypothetical protein